MLQMIDMIIAGYFEDDDSDELTNDPVFKSVLEKDALASQPTVSRFFNRMDEDTLNQFLTIGRILRFSWAAIAGVGFIRPFAC